MLDPEIVVSPTPELLAHDAAERVTRLASEAIATSGRFTITLAGGSTPKALYTLLAQEPFRSRIDWLNVHIYFGDERTVPPNHADSNYKMAHEALLSKVPIPADNVNRMRGEIDPHAAAKEYGELLKSHFGDDGFDVALLGMGDDGHTASLFPHTEALKELNHRCVANVVEKLNTTRLTLTAPFINRAKHVIVLIAGGSKSERVSEVLEQADDPDRLPIQLVDPRPNGGTLVWMLDAAAAGMSSE